VALSTLIAWANIGVSKDLARLERILELLETDHERFWRQRANLNTTFEGSRVFTDAQGFRLAEGENKEVQPAFRAATFGASPTFGYAVEAEETYAKRTESAMRKSGGNVQVINLGQIGYSSWQGLKVFSTQVPKLKPDLVTVSYMVNDIDRLRFFFTNGKSDENTETPSPARLRVSNFISQFSPTALLVAQFRRILLKTFGTGDNAARYNLGHRRVPPDLYEKNLLEFISIARREKTPLIFILMPFRLPHPVPDEPENLKSMLDMAQRRIDEGRSDDALAMLDALDDQEQFASRLIFLRGRALEAAGRKSEAQQIYKKAVNHLVYDCARDAPRYNAVMARVAMQNNIPLVDAASALGGDQIEEQLFVPNDYIHPNPAGHEIISRCLTKAITRVRAGETGFFLQRCGVFDED
jgi:lysophospholipase L1-like esterase